MGLSGCPTQTFEKLGVAVLLGEDVAFVGKDGDIDSDIQWRAFNMGSQTSSVEKV
jgi:hypothetical protein